MTRDPTTRDLPAPTAFQLFLLFSRIGLGSFGGGLSGWFLREFVQRRAWMEEEEFLNGLSLSQALPGVNVANMAIWIGYRLLGRVGALAAFAGIVVPPAILIVLIDVMFTWLKPYPLTGFALDGAAAAAIGLSLFMGIALARRVPRRAVPLCVLVATFVAVGVVRLPLFWVVSVGGIASVALEYGRLSRT